MDEARSSARFDREVMAMLLSTNVQLVNDVLAADEDAPAQVMRAIAATRSLDLIVEDTLRALVDQARATGRTWAELGEVLHVTRQAAFQRFGGGRGAALNDDNPGAPVEGAVERAVEVLQAFLDSDFEAARRRFGERMLDACSAELMADVREKVHRLGGEIQALGTPAVSIRDGYTGVDIPIALESAEGVGRVVLDADRQVVGFFVRRAEDRL
jgi:hypothetical protein